MKDDINTPNLGQPPTSYEPQFLFRALNELEKFARLFLSKGPIRVSDISADSVTVTGPLIATVIRVSSYTVAGVPSASTSGVGSIIFVSNETGGAVLAFSDGTNWRRVTDRAVIA